LLTLELSAHSRKRQTRQSMGPRLFYVTNNWFTTHGASRTIQLRQVAHRSELIRTRRNGGVGGRHN
jgi:hypothetical protein